MKKVAVIQSNYIPWKGYFDMINDVDLFIFHDDLQYTKNDWRNRNKIKTINGSDWLTVPVGTDEHRLICDVEIKDVSFFKKHWNVISKNYSKARYYSLYKDFFEHVYLDGNFKNLSELNQYLIKKISKDFLGIKATFCDSRSYGLELKKLDRLVELLGKCGADVYFSGPSAKNYINPEAFELAGIELIYKDYSGYPEYQQFYPPFDHYVTILDLLFHTGPAASWYIWGWRSGLPRPDRS